ncbi:protein ABHD18 isoform X1 [Drosophila grimshawi]|uniref:GH14725 n=2 Tax=Drosophila grimshawi TaxID=7222 RepID=B4IWY3_DROGR|nr:protein ABHD18 isoform X1 [Drosophila grimshawi]EDV97384.1 GH14725 [Drosophila grimshawi]
MPPSKLDSLYRRMLITKFFEKGWGTPENLHRVFQFRKVISCRETCFKLVPRDYPVEITKKKRYSDSTLIEGNFKTPMELHMPGVVPKAAQKAYFQILLPNKWVNEEHKPICIHLAGTGDHFFWRRRNFIAKPLMKDANIGSIILENPFYGLRKPDDQIRSNLRNVSDIFVMGGCLILECLVLLHWCERNGFGPLGVTGLSMGGHMASLAATNWPKPLVLVPCLSWSTASAVFTTGVMSQSINWDMLETQYYSDGQYRERLSKMVTVIDDAFAAGQKFIQNFNESLHELKEDIDDTRKIQSTEPEPGANNNKIHDISLENADSSIFLSKPQDNKLYQLKDNLSTNLSNNSNLPLCQADSQTEASALTRLMKYILPLTSDNKNKRIDITKTNWWEREALQFMRGMMDECTHLKNFSVPFDTSLIIAVCARDDAYVPREGCTSLEDIWPGAEIRYLDAGHVSAYILHQKLFRSCIKEAFDRAKKIYDAEKYKNASAAIK